MNTNLKQLLSVLCLDINISDKEEVFEACQLIIEVQSMNGAERDTLKAAFLKGPLYAGDLPSKVGRDDLTIRGFMTKVVVKGEDSFEACTQKGFWAYKLLEAGC